MRFGTARLPTAPPPIKTTDLESLMAWLYFCKYSTDPIFSSEGIVPGAARRVPVAATRYSNGIRFEPCHSRSKIASLAVMDITFACTMACLSLFGEAANTPEYGMKALCS